MILRRRFNESNKQRAPIQRATPYYCRSGWIKTISLCVFAFVIQTKARLGENNQLFFSSSLRCTRTKAFFWGGLFAGIIKIHSHEWPFNFCRPLSVAPRKLRERLRGRGNNLFTTRKFLSAGYDVPSSSLSCKVMIEWAAPKNNNCLKFLGFCSSFAIWNRWMMHGQSRLCSESYLRSFVRGNNEPFVVRCHCRTYTHQSDH